MSGKCLLVMEMGAFSIALAHTGRIPHREAARGNTPCLLYTSLAKIGIDGKRYSEVFFTSFDSDVLGLYDHLYECENIDELNELGHALLEVRDKGGLEAFEAALVLGNHTRSVKDLINLTQNLDLYRFYPDISDDEGLGRLYADEMCIRDSIYISVVMGSALWTIPLS